MKMKTRLLTGILVLIACQPRTADPDFDMSTLPGSDFEGPAFEFELVDRGHLSSSRDWKRGCRLKRCDHC